MNTLNIHQLYKELAHRFHTQHADLLQTCQVECRGGAIAIHCNLQTVRQLTSLRHAPDLMKTARELGVSRILFLQGTSQIGHLTALPLKMDDL